MAYWESFQVIPALKERIEFLQRHDASIRVTVHPPHPEKRKALWQNWLRQMLIAVLRLDEPRHIEALAGANIQYRQEIDDATEPLGVDGDIERSPDIMGEALPALHRRLQDRRPLPPFSVSKTVVVRNESPLRRRNGKPPQGFMVGSSWLAVRGWQRAWACAPSHMVGGTMLADIEEQFGDLRQSQPSLP